MLRHIKVIEILNFSRHLEYIFIEIPIYTWIHRKIHESVHMVVLKKRLGIKVIFFYGF